MSLGTSDSISDSNVGHEPQKMESKRAASNHNNPHFILFQPTVLLQFYKCHIEIGLGVIHKSRAWSVDGGGLVK